MDDGASRQPPEATALDISGLKALSRRSDAKGSIQLATHLGLLSLTGALVLWSRSSPWLAPALLGHGIVLIFLFAPLHECIHRTAFRSRPFARSLVNRY